MVFLTGRTTENRRVNVTYLAQYDNGRIFGSTKIQSEKVSSNSLCFYSVYVLE